MDTKVEYLDYLFYTIGKQKCDYELQIQNQDGFMSKRKKYSDIGFSKDMWWLQKVNARTLLENEIVLDIDPNEGETQEQLVERCIGVVNRLKEYHLDHWGVFKSNRAIHIHIFMRQLFFYPEQQRRELKKRILKAFGADIQKFSEKTTIALEFSGHWKNPLKIKELISGNILNGK